MSEMRVYVCNDHDGYYPVPVASVIVAPNEQTARKALDAELVANGLREGTGTLREIDTGKTACIMLSNGNY
jgi:hypothetical protein